MKTLLTLTFVFFMFMALAFCAVLMYKECVLCVLVAVVTCYLSTPNTNED